LVAIVTLNTYNRVLPLEHHLLKTDTRHRVKTILGVTLSTRPSGCRDAIGVALNRGVIADIIVSRMFPGVTTEPDIDVGVFDENLTVSIETDNFPPGFDGV
jgi:hypothetical protein